MDRFTELIRKSDFWSQLLFWAANQKNVATSTNDKELLIHIIELFWYLKKSVDWYVINISYRFIEQPLKPNTSDK